MPQFGSHAWMLLPSSYIRLCGFPCRYSPCLTARKRYSSHRTKWLDLPDSSLYFEEQTRKISRGDIIGLPIIHHYDYVSDLPPGHRFAMRKFHGVMKFLKIDNVISMKQVVQPDPVSARTAQLAHSANYIDNFFAGNTTEDEQRRTGFVWSEGLLRRCRLETGGTILGARLALGRGLACSTGGGTHHAFPTHGSGYCLINDLAITARYLISKSLAHRVLIVDLDVHQGDGTAFIFQNDEQVFTFSMHCQSNFPIKKEKSNLDIGLSDGTGDDKYLSELQRHLPRIIEDFSPDIILYDAGVDTHRDDELGKLNLTDMGLYRRDHYVLDTSVSQGIPCMTVIGGGYSRDLDVLSARHTIVHRAATKIWFDSGL